MRTPEQGRWYASERERRLWRWVALLIVTIYLTLGLASSLAQWLYDQGLVTIAFLGATGLVLLALLTQGLRVRPGGYELGVGLGIVAVYQFVLVRLAIPERSHLIEYSVVACLIYEALVERKNSGGYAPFPALTAIAMTTVVGGLDEGIQYWLPNRVFDRDDLLFNFLASCMGVLSTALLHRVRQFATKRSDLQTSEPTD